MKTLTMYLRAAKTEAEEAGISTDGMADSVSKLRDSVMELTGVDIMLDEDTFKSTYQIIKEISEVWDDLTDVSQANVLNILGGKRNANSIAALITNFSTAIEATETATNSAGSALKENEKYLDSIAGKTATLKASFEELSSTIVDSSLIKFFLDLTNSIINVATALSKWGALLPTIVAGMTKIALVKQTASVKNLASTFESMCANGTEFNTLLGVLRTSTVQFTVYQKKQLATLLTSSTAFQNLNIQQKSAILTATGLQNAAQSGTLAMTGFASSVKVAFKSLSMFNKVSIIITILSTLWQIGSKIVDDIKQKQDDLIDSANEIIDNYAQAQETYNSNIKTLESLRSEYEQLSAGVDSNGRNVSLTKDEYERYLEVIDQIADISPEVVSGYNDEGHAVLDYKAALDQAINSQEEYIQNQKDIYIGSGNEVFGGKAAEYQNGLDELGEAGKKFGEALTNGGLFDDTQIKAWRSALNDIGVSWANIKWSTAYSQLNDIYHNSEKFLTSLRDSGVYTNEELNEIQLRISGLASGLTTINSIEKDQVEYLSTWMQYQYEAGSLEWFGDISPAAMDEFVAGLYDINKPLMSWSDNLKLAMAYGEEFATALNTDAAQELITMSQGLDDATVLTTDYYDAIETFIAGFDGTDAVREQLASFFYSLKEGAEEAADSLDDLPGEFTGFADAIEDMSKGASLLKTAMEEMRDSGGLSLDTIDSLQSFLGNEEDVTDYLYVENGLIKLNTELWAERTKQIQQVDLASLTAQLNAARETLYNSDDYEEQMAAYDEILRLEKLIALYNSAGVESSFNLSDMVDELSDVQTEVNSLITAMDGLGEAGAKALTDSELNELALKYPELFKNEDLWNATTANEQLAALQNFLNQYETTYDEIIQTRIDALESEKTEKEALGEDVTAYNELIANLTRVKDMSLMDLFGADDAEETTQAYESLSDAISDVTDLAELLNTISENEDPLDTFKAISEFIDEHPDGFSFTNFYNDDWTLKDPNAFQLEWWINSIIEHCKELPGYTDAAGNALKSMFYDALEGSEEASESLSDLSSAMSELEKTANIMADIKSGSTGGAVFQDIVSLVNDSDVLELADFYDETTGELLSFETISANVFAKLYAQMANADGATLEYVQTFSSYITSIIDGSEDGADALDQLSDAFGDVKDAATMLNDINTGDDFISNMQSVADFIKSNEGFSFADFLTGDGTFKEIDADSDLANRIFEALIEPMKELEGWSDTYETQLRSQFNKIIKGEEDVNASFDELKDTLSAVSSISSSLTSLSDEDTTIVDQIQTMMDLAETFKDSSGAAYDWTQWIESISTDGSSIQWNTDAILALSDAQVDAAFATAGLTGKYPALIEQVKASARATIQAEEETNKLTDAYEKMSGATSVNKNYGGYTQLTTDAYQELIEVDARYATAVEYQNGVMVLNAEKHAEVTQKILEETKATAEAEKQAILTSEEYQNLTKALEMGTIDTTGMQRLLDLETQIKGYDVLAEEIDNATSAYYRWVNRKGDDGMDRYSQALEAFELINDTLKDDESEYYGRIGREEFSQAVDFVIGENVEVDTAEFDRGMALAKRYLTEGATGAANFYDDLVSHGLIDSTTGALDSSIAEISQALGVSEEMVRTMIDRINEYQTDANKITVKDPEIDTEESDSKIEQLTTDLADVQTNIDTINATPVDVQVGDTSLLGKVSSALTSIINKIRQINSTSVTIKTSTIKTTTTPRVNGKAAVSGSAFAAGGKTLVGELGMETVVDPYNNRWYTVGNKGAEFVNLPEGAIVFNHLQTQDLLGFGNTASRGSSMASGNAAAKLGLARNQLVLLDSKKSVSDKTSGTPTKPKRTSSGSSNSKKSSSSSSSSSASALDTLLEKYQQINEQYEHLIAHQEFLYEEAERGYDFPGMQSSLEEQIKIYRQKAQNSFDAVEAMKKQGADDTSEALQEMEEAYWSAINSMYSTMEELNALYVDALKEKIDGIQDAYQDFADAAEEFNDSGNISIDAFQKLVENGGEYLSCLEYIDGQFVINKESLEKLLAAEKEQLAIESALSYVNELKQLLTDNDANALAEMVDLSGQVSKNSWDAVYAQAALLKSAGLTDEQFAKIIKNIDALRAISNNTVADLDDGTSSTTSAYSDQKDALEEILSLTKDLIKYETDEKIDAINDQIDAYQKLVDLRKEALQTAKDENDYDEEIAEKTKEIANLQSQIDKLSLDDSREAKAERASLIEELAEKQKELAETQSDHAYDAQTDALDKLSTEYEESRQSEIDTLENSVSSAEKLYQLAISRINSSWDSLYGDIIAWNTEAGSSINQDITENWEKAAEAVKRYGSFLAAISGETTSEDGTTTSSSTVVATGDLTDTQALIDSVPKTETTEPVEEVRTRTVKMVQVNNGKWNVRTGAGMSNKAIGIARTGDQYEYLGKKGSWYNILYNGRSAWVSGNGSSVVDVVQKYHTGGLVGGNESAEDNEVLAILKKKETVLTEGQTKGLYKIIDFQKELAERLGHAIGSLGSPSANLTPALAGIGTGVSRSSTSDSFVFNPTINVDISGVASTNDSDARSFGSKIASTALDALQEAFTRKGITSIGNSKLKQ